MITRRELTVAFKDIGWLKLVVSSVISNDTYVVPPFDYGIFIGDAYILQTDHTRVDT